jgi:hypothetical protein
MSLLETCNWFSVMKGERIERNMTNDRNTIKKGTEGNPSRQHKFNAHVWTWRGNFAKSLPRWILSISFSQKIRKGERYLQVSTKSVKRIWSIWK